MKKQPNEQNQSTTSVSPDILNHPERRLRLPETCAFTGYGPASVYAKMAEGTFPAAQKMGGRAVAWRLGDLIEFVKSRPSTIEG